VENTAALAGKDAAIAEREATINELLLSADPGAEEERDGTTKHVSSFLAELELLRTKQRKSRFETTSV
jgi:hypothetical protein